MPLASNIAPISSNVKTKSTSLRTDFLEASSFFAAHGPTKTTRLLGCFSFIKRAVNTIGVKAIDI